MPKGRDATVEDIPTEAIDGARASYTRVKVRVTRRNPKGHLATVYNGVFMTLDELLEIDGWLKKMAGGGRYHVFARDPENPSQDVVPSFYVNVEGDMRKPRNLDGPDDPSFEEGASTMYQQQPPGPGRPTGPWVAGLTPRGQQRYYGAGDVWPMP